MNQQVTHKQHYVWRKYLEPWGYKNGGKVFVWWNNQKVTECTDVFDILREKDFYEYKPLNKLELFCLKQMFANTKNQTVKNANSNIIALIDLISSINGEIIQDEQFKNFLIQTGEDVQSNIEKIGIKLLSALKQSDLSMFNYDENGAMIEFFVFLLFQFFRTKSSREKSVNAVSGSNGLLKKLYRENMKDKNEYDIDWNKIYNLGYVFSVNKICFVMANKHTHIKLMKAGKVKFIVSDQPVYNAAENITEDFDLFYPISPDMAVLVSCKYSENEIIELTDSEVLSINQNTVKNAYKFIIGVNRDYVDFNWKN